MGNLNVVEAAKIMGKTEMFLRMGLREGRFPFGSAVANKNGRWSYHIAPNKFYEYMGIKNDLAPEGKV